jgi:hypothetical protein
MFRRRASCVAAPNLSAPPADLRDQPLPAQGTLQVIVHLCALGEDFADDHLDAEESLSALLDRCLAGVPRIAYSALTEL